METSVNNKCKAFTSLEQSRKLANILPLESADMFYSAGNETQPTFRLHSYGHIMSDKDVCAWSLAALLGVLPDCPDLSKHTDNKWYITTYPNDVHTCLMAYDNPVDACYEMIIRLNELTLL